MKSINTLLFGIKKRVLYVAENELDYIKKQYGTKNVIRVTNTLLGEALTEIEYRLKQ